MNNKKFIILLIVIVLIIVGIVVININNNKNESDSNAGEGNVVKNEETEMYEVYDANGKLVTTLEDESMKEIYESNPYFDSDPTN